MKKILSGVIALTLTCQMLSAQTPNTLTAKEKKEGWVLLFDGKTTQGWHTYNKAELGNGWTAANGELQFNPAATGRGDITTDKEYENYELALDWKIEEGGNSGIIFGVNEDPKYQWSFLTGVEMQVLDNEKAGDNKIDTHVAGSLYDLIAAPRTAAKPANQWNTAVIRKKDGKLTFWLNGIQTADVQMWGDEWKTLVTNSKFKEMPAYGTYKKGHICLQDHGNIVAFRNIKIKQL
ncbi:DUF1080 domain-containing protein [Mucilaginibacter hurinus]|uniref:DUF1080 domain-containing protein n=1 Tax=Mucilaginibacter hurinus TaxID=2201324 RepID=A0A367GRH8_9SPHI|nr:DUF1080 domain-containing protein [Mucilaginibacter hurinus]RCH55678.1 DUF1080 domain-containing protein [Mucilaginibacter hurinus]